MQTVSWFFKNFLWVRIFIKLNESGNKEVQCWEMGNSTMFIANLKSMGASNMEVPINW